MRYVIYARKSTDDKKNQIESIPDQLKVVKNLAEERGLNVVDIITEKKSASKPGRPEFNRMIQGIRKNRYDAILTWHLDRLSRNMEDGGVLMHMIQTGIIKKVYTPTEQHDCLSNMVYLAVQFGVATDQVIRLSKDVLRGMKSRAEQGYWHSIPPLGYKTLGKGVIEPNDNFSYVRKAFELYDSGNFSVETLSDHLFEIGLRSRFGNKYGKSNIHKLLKSPAYKGEIHVQWKGDDEVSVYKAKHLPAVSEDLWERVQQRLDRKNQCYHPSGAVKPYLFRKKLWCACGCLMSCYRTKGNNYIECKNPMCDNHYKVKGKTRKTLREDFVKLVSSLLLSQIEATGKKLKEFESLVAASLKEQKAEQKNNSATIKRQITALENKIDVLTDKLVTDIVDETTYKRKKKQLETEMKAKKRLLENKSDDHQVLTIYQKLYSIAEYLKTVFLAGDETAQREILELLISSIKPAADAMEIEFTVLGGLLFYGLGFDGETQTFELEYDALGQEIMGVAPSFVLSGAQERINFELFACLQNQRWQIEKLYKLVYKKYSS